MKTTAKTLEFKFERTIPAPPGEVFDAWLNPRTPGTPWHIADKLLWNPTVDGLFYWTYSGTPHFGRFTELDRGRRLSHTWMSPYTLGLESTVTVTFEKKGQDTLMTLVHAGLPDADVAQSHQQGWNYHLGMFVESAAKRGAQ